MAQLSSFDSLRNRDVGYPMPPKLSDSKKYSVLVIDDQDNWRELLTEVLEGQFNVVNADSYESALSAIRSHSRPFHVVVTDMRLVDGEPGNEDGLRLVEYLNKRGDETRTIVVTGYPTVATAKHSLSALAAYDYLEKRPSDGSAFNHRDFRNIVYQAAQEAEDLRPDGFTDVDPNILMLESDPRRAAKLKSMIFPEGRKVSWLRYTKQLQEELNELGKDYGLILINEDLASPETLAILKESYPRAGMILLTSRDVGDIFNTMRDHPVLTALSFPHEESEIMAFRELVHSAFSARAVKYVSTTITNLQSGEHETFHDAGLLFFRSGSSYELTLSLVDKPTEHCTKILLPPTEQRKGKADLSLFIYAGQIKIEPSVEREWEIPLSSGHPHPLRITLIPTAVGSNTVLIEISQSHRWLARVEINIQVI